MEAFEVESKRKKSNTSNVAAVSGYLVDAGYHLWRMSCSYRGRALGQLQKRSATLWMPVVWMTMKFFGPALEIGQGAVEG
jgi:hypothetical protein